MNKEPRQTDIVVDARGVTIDLPLFGKGLPARAKGSRAVGGRLIKRGRTSMVRALDDITFTIEWGQRLGVVGINGAGKSTLLRVLAGILKPTSGALTVEGKISTLFTNRLSVGRAITGRETIFVSCLLLGLEPREIESLIPEIIDFSELEDYIDLPMRSYSAGMATRLGFAIVTSVKPEVLLIDEVFGAGDRRFQKKAKARVMDIFESASTMVLATQSVGMIERMCYRLLWLDHGQVKGFGSIEDILPKFLEAQAMDGGDDRVEPVEELEAS